MNLFARILSHGFALVLVALLAIGLIYRGELFPGMELPDFLVLDRTRDGAPAAADAAGPAPAEEAAGDDAAAVATEVPDEGGVVEPATEVADASEEAGQMAATALTAGEGVEEAVPAQMDASDLPEAAAEDLSEAAAGRVSTAVTAEGAPAGHDVAAPLAEPVAEPPAADIVTQEEVTVAETPSPEPALPVTPAAEETAPAEPVSPVSEMAADTQTTAPVTVPKQPAKSAYELLAAAREAYWLRDYSLAEENYRAMISLDPDNPDGYGELGNMYFSQGKWDLASVAYFEAGKRLADEGQLEQARQLVDVLRGLQGSQADELEEYVAAKASANQ